MVGLKLVSFIIFFGIITTEKCAEASKFLTVLILSQQAEYDDSIALTLRASFTQQSSELNEDIEVLISNIDFKNVSGSWAVWPLMKRLGARSNGSISDWLLICEPNTNVNLSKLLEFLQKFDASKSHFIGRALHDERPVIIHHFYGFDMKSVASFEYPDFAAGTILSRNLFEQIFLKLATSTFREFSIDAKHEFALMVSKLGVPLTNIPTFCLLSDETNCITKFTPASKKNCKKTVSGDGVLFAVKTYSEYHNSRVVIVKRTWAKETKHLKFFSDIDDPFIPTLNLGINNTIRGHCGKTEAIFKHVVMQEEFVNISWLVITDDDTLLSTSRLYSLLSCYDPEQKLILGERYGYGFDVDGDYGYDYPTGGAGMVFSRTAIIAIASNCRCPKIDSPDDMIIGACANQLKIPVIHSAAFHQAQPQSYSPLYLARLPPISFHKFEDINPYSVYVELLQNQPPREYKTVMHEEF